MSTILVEPVDQAKQILPLVRSAIHSEIVRLELALKLAQERLLPFEHKYAVSSEYFIAQLAAEDLQGGDDEYVQWAGEFLLAQQLERKLIRLREIKYGDSDVLRPA